MKSLVAKAVGILAVGFLFFRLGSDIHYSDQKGIFDGLRDMSAIIFGIMGAWIAVLHPDLLTQLVKPETIQDGSIPDSRHLITPMIYAALSLAIIMTVGMLAPLVYRFRILYEHLEIVRGISFSIAGVLSVLLIWSLILSFVPYAKAKMFHDLAVARKKKADQLAGK